MPGDRGTPRALAAGRIVLAALVAAPALAQSPTPSAPAPAAQAAPADPAYEAARLAFEALPEAERKAIQDALVWTGDFNGTTSGGFGKRTHDGILAYQKRAKLPTDGVLDMKARAALQAAAQKERDALGFAVMPDPRTGAQVGLPRRVLAKQDTAPGPGGGTRWQSADGKITLDTRAHPPGDEDLPALFERLTTLEAPGRKVTYKLLRPDFLVVAGETPTGKFYVRYAASATAGLRGYSLGYDKVLAKEFDRSVIAIANAFVPFPGTAATTAATAVPATAPAVPPARPSAVEPPKAPALVATGLLVGPRRVVTNADAVAGCPDLRVAKTKARVAERADNVAVLEFEGAARPTTPVARRATAVENGGLVVLSFATVGGYQTLVATPAAIASGRLVAPLQPGASGAPAFDRTGALVGVVGALPAQPRQTAGVVPPLSHPLTGAEALAGVLGTGGAALANEAASPARTAGEIAAAVGPGVLPIECVR